MRCSVGDILLAPPTLFLFFLGCLGGCGEASAVAPSESIPPSDPPVQTPDWDRVLADTAIAGDVVVPDGERWLIGADVEVAGNVRTVNGTIGLRAGSSLRFVGAEPEEYAGGGLHYTEEFERDVGLWIGGPQASGVLDIRCTPKTGWNRTGQDPTWEPDDEYWIAPTEEGDFLVRRWYPGDPIPQIDDRVPAAEVVNVTRDCVIRGAGHIHIHSQAAQRIEYVRLENLGISREDGPVTGRYALHFHMSGDGSEGTVVRGVAAVGTRGTVFVPHASHGITMLDNVSVNSWAEGLWWDVGHDTEDLLVDRMVVLGVHFPREVFGATTRFDAYTLGSGRRMEIRNSVAAGVRDNKLSVGFDWVSGGQAPNPVWIFEEGNVAHNNSGPGLRFWTNLSHDHPVAGYVGYRNGEGGIENGAYKNRVNYRDVTLVDDHIFHHTSARDGAAYAYVEVYARDGPALYVDRRRLESDAYIEFRDVTLDAGPGAPKVLIRSGDNPWLAHFIDSNVTPDDFAFETLVGGNEGTHILIDHEDGRRWEILVEKGRKIVRER